MARCLATTKCPGNSLTTKVTKITKKRPNVILFTFVIFMIFVVQIHTLVHVGGFRRSRSQSLWKTPDLSVRLYVWAPK
jgi:hypothetical protein